MCTQCCRRVLHFAQILATHGAKGFFKGLSIPLVTVAAYNAVLFASRGSMERMLAHPDGGWQPLGNIPQPSSVQTGRGTSESRQWIAACLHAEHACSTDEPLRTHQWGLAAPMPPDLHLCRRLTSDYHGPPGVRRWRRAGGLVRGMPHRAHQVSAAGAQWRHAAGENFGWPSWSSCPICKMHIAPC